MDSNNNNAPVPSSADVTPTVVVSSQGTPVVTSQSTTATAPASTSLVFAPGGGFNFASVGAATSGTGTVPNLGFGNYAGAPLTGGVAIPRMMSSPVEKPDKFDGTNFKIWSEKMKVYVTFHGMERFLTEMPPAIVPDDATSFMALEAWKHSDYICRNAIMSCFCSV